MLYGLIRLLLFYYIGVVVIEFSDRLRSDLFEVQRVIGRKAI
jgi:hypothetical protein